LASERLALQGELQTVLRECDEASSQNQYSADCTTFIGMLHNGFAFLRPAGMTELEEAELTDGQGRALSAHKSRAYEGYAKRPMERALAATRKRHAHRLASDPNVSGTEFPNGAADSFPNELKEQTVTPK
jgi:hypothetical protein